MESDVTLLLIENGPRDQATRLASLLVRRGIWIWDCFAVTNAPQCDVKSSRKPSQVHNEDGQQSPVLGCLPAAMAWPAWNRSDGVAW